MKKLLLGLGSIATVVAPVITVVSCGGDDSKTSSTPTISFEKAKVGGFIYDDTAAGGLGKFLISKEEASKAGSITIINEEGDSKKTISWTTAITTAPANFSSVTIDYDGTVHQAVPVNNKSLVAVNATMFLMSAGDGAKFVATDKAEVIELLNNILMSMEGKNLTGITLTSADPADKTNTKLSTATEAAINEVLKPIGFKLDSAKIVTAPTSPGGSVMITSVTVASLIVL